MKLERGKTKNGGKINSEKIEMLKKKSIAAIMLLIVAVFATIMPAEARIGPPGTQYDRQAMVYEAYYAVTGQLGNYPTVQTLGQWNYMSYDIPAQNTIISRIGSSNAG